jgi:hypothetical protein
MYYRYRGTRGDDTIARRDYKAFSIGARLQYRDKRAEIRVGGVCTFGERRSVARRDFIDFFIGAHLQDRDKRAKIRVRDGYYCREKQIPPTHGKGGRVMTIIRNVFASWSMRSHGSLH